MGSAVGPSYTTGILLPPNPYKTPFVKEQNPTDVHPTAVLHPWLMCETLATRRNSDVRRVVVVGVG